MKANKIDLLSIVAVLLVLMFLRAQPYDLSWSTMEGGGGTSTSSVYTITGTIGQPDVGRLHSSNFTIDGGFWSIIAVIQEPGAPLLSLRITHTNAVTLAWPIVWPGFELQESPDLSATNWSRVTTPPVIVVKGENQTEKQVTVPTPTANRFYRLKNG